MVWDVLLDFKGTLGFLVSRLGWGGPDSWQVSLVQGPSPGPQDTVSFCSELLSAGRQVGGDKKKSGKAVHSVECVLQTSGRNHCDFCFLSFELITVLLLESGGTSLFILEK